MKAIIKSTVDMDAGTITFDVAGAGEAVLRVERLSSDLFQHAAYHGLKQRIGDAAALSRDTATGAPASPADKLAEMQRVIAHLESGTSEWSMKPAGGGGGESLTLRAVAQHKGLSIESARERVQAYADAKLGGDFKKALAQLRLAPAIAEIMAQMRATKPARIDADAALGEI